MPDQKIKMARPIRLEFPGALYHITARGDRRDDIYENDADRKSFLSLFESVCADHNWVCHAYCLMSNHYHLLVESKRTIQDSIADNAHIAESLIS